MNEKNISSPKYFFIIIYDCEAHLLDKSCSCLFVIIIFLFKYIINFVTVLF